MSGIENDPLQSTTPDIEALKKQYGSLRNVPITREFDTPAGHQTVTFTVEEWMKAFCPEDSENVSDEEFDEMAANFILGKGHGQ